MSAVDPTTLLLQLGLLLSMAFLLGRLAQRVGLPATTGELATGLVLGPSLLGSVVPAGAPVTARGPAVLYRVTTNLG